MATTRSIFALILIAASVNQYKAGRLQDHFYLDYVVCKFNPLFSVNGTCKLSFINRLEKSLSVSSFVFTQLDDLIGRVQLYYKFRSGYKPLLIDITSNLCDFIRGKAESKVMSLIIPKVQAYSTINFTCPYRGRVDIKNMPINMGIFDYIFLPAGSYMLNLTLRAKKDYAWNGKLYFILPEGKTTEDDRMG